MTDKKNIALVVPSIREASWNRFCAEWEEVGLFVDVDILLVEDNPNRTFDAGIAHEHWSWEDIDNELGENSWIIPRRSDTVRSFGYLKAYQMGYEYIMTLDDDCYPNKDFRDSLVSTHLKCLNERSRWFNTLNSVKPRGIPFYNVGIKRKVYVNHGLWTSVLDYDAPTQLVQPTPEQFSYDNRIVPQHSYFPMCGMNVMWRREATVLMYHLLQGSLYEPSSPLMGPQKLPFDRFGDIWCGIFMKRICDELGWNVSTGIPYIHHDRASNVFANLKKEANGLEVNEKLWELVDDVALVIHQTPANTYAELGKKSCDLLANAFPEHAGYFKMLGGAMVLWACYFK